MDLPPYDAGFNRNEKQQGRGRTFDQVAEQLQNEKLERQHTVESIQAEFDRQKEERRKANMIYQKKRAEREMMRAEEASQKLKVLERERERKCAEENMRYKQTIEHLNREAAAESRWQLQIHTEELKKTENFFELKKRQNIEEAENTINVMKNETKQLETESHRKLQQAENQILNAARLAEERKQQNEREMLQLQEQTRIETEKSRSMWETSKRQMYEQMRIFDRMIMHTIWNIQLEQHFTSRLNFLRTSHREVTRRYLILSDVLFILKRNTEPDKKMNTNILQSKKNLLTNSIDVLKQLMEDEYLNMERIIFEKQWSVLHCVKNSVGSVADSCKRFDELLSRMDYIKLEDFIVEIKTAHEDICEKCRLIPTFDYLKKTYSPQTNQPSSSQLSIDDEPSQFKIEEIQ